MSGNKDQLELEGGTAVFRAFHRVVRWTLPEVRREKWALLEAQSKVVTLL